MNPTNMPDDNSATHHNTSISSTVGLISCQSFMATMGFYGVLWRQDRKRIISEGVMASVEIGGIGLKILVKSQNDSHEVQKVWEEEVISEFLQDVL